MGIKRKNGSGQPLSPGKIMLKKKVISVLLFFLTAVLWAQPEGHGLTVPHITALDSDFETQIFLINTTNREHSFNINPYDLQGTPFDAIPITLGADEVRSLTREALFGSNNVSHFNIEDRGAIRISIGYRSKSSSQSIAHVTPFLGSVFSFRIDPSPLPEIWDGMAVVNSGVAPANLNITQLNENGEVIARSENLPSIAPNAKLLHVFSDSFSISEGHHFRVESDQPVSFVALRGTRPNADLNALFESVPARRNSGSRAWVTHVSPPNSLFNSRLLVENLVGENKTLMLQPYAENGRALEPVEAAVAGNSQLKMDPAELNPLATHFSFEPDPALRVLVSYQRKNIERALVTQFPVLDQGRSFLVLPGDEQSTWDGFAMVNTNDEPVDIEIRHILESGEEDSFVFEGVESHRKTLFLPQSHFTSAGNGFYRITASGNLSFLALRGDYDSKITYANLPVPVQFTSFTDKPIVDFSQETNIQLVSASATEVVANYPNGTPVPEVGSILAGTEENPFLCEVTGSSVNDNGEILFQVKQVGIQEVIPDGRLAAVYDLRIDGEEGANKQNSTINFMNSASLNVSGKVSVDAALQPMIEWSTESGDLDSFRLSALGTLSLDLTGEIKGQMNGNLSVERPIFSRNLGTRTFFIGYFPVFINWILDVDAKLTLESNAEALVSWNTGADFRIEAGIEKIFEPGADWTSFKEFSHTFHPVSKTLTVNNDLIGRLNLMPRLTAKIYGVSGPFVGFDGYQQAVLDFDQRTYDLGLGLNADMGVSLDAPLFGNSDLESSINIYSNFWPLASGTFVLPGTLVGRILDAVTNEALSDVTVTVFHEGVLVAEDISGEDGNFAMVLPASDAYRVSFSKPGYLSDDYRNVQVQELTETFLETLLKISEDHSGNGTISGTVFNALTGAGVDDLLIQFRSGVNTLQGPVVASATTHGGGTYTVENLAAGNYTGEVSGEGYNSGQFTALCIGGRQTFGQDGTVTPTLSSGETRIVLTWGQTPSDLDSYLTGPTTSGSRFTIYYGNKQYSDANTSVNLDRDDVSSFGPETTTIVVQTSGVYRFYVHDYSNGGSQSSNKLSNSGARVEVYRGDGLAAAFNVPSGGRGGTLWSVFELDGNNITPLNTLTFGGNINKTKKDQLGLDSLPQKQKGTPIDRRQSPDASTGRDR